MQETSVQTWEKILQHVRKNIPDSAFSLWFKNTVLQKIDDRQIEIGVSNRFIKGWLKSNYLRLLEESAAAVTGRQKKVSFRIVSEMRNIVENSRKKILLTPPQKTHKLNDLNSNFQFSNFATGPDNNLAFLIVNELSKSSGILYNPLLLYGNHGVGKTHLLQAFCHTHAEKFPEKKIHYCSCETFMHAFINSFKNQNYESFKHKFRKIDVLVIDDIHYLCEGNRAKTQEECLHTIESLVNTGKQVVIGSHIHPDKMTALKTKLRDILKSGLIAEIHLPGIETRRNILMNKSGRLLKEIPDHIISYLTDNTHGNIRELEGILMRITALATLENREVDMDVVREAMGSAGTANTHAGIGEDRPGAVLQFTAEYFQVAAEELKKHKRGDGAVPRQVCMFLLRKELDMPHSEIGRLLNCKSHGSVIYAERKVKRNLQRDSKISEAVSALQKKIQREIL